MSSKVVRIYCWRCSLTMYLWYKFACLLLAHAWTFPRSSCMQKHPVGTTISYQPLLYFPLDVHWLQFYQDSDFKGIHSHLVSGVHVWTHLIQRWSSIPLPLSIQDSNAIAEHLLVQWTGPVHKTALKALTESKVCPQLWWKNTPSTRWH